jgi:hypothetical protein
MIVLSSAASVCLIGRRERSARHQETMFCVTVFRMRVIGCSHPTMVRNRKHSMKALSLLKQEVGSFTFVHRKSSSLATSSTLCFVTSSGSVSGSVETDSNSAWFGWSFGPARTYARDFDHWVSHPYAY